ERLAVFVEGLLVLEPVGRIVETRQRLLRLVLGLHPDRHGGQHSHTPDTQGGTGRRQEGPGKQPANQSHAHHDHTLAVSVPGTLKTNWSASPSAPPGTVRGRVCAGWGR